MMRYDSRLGRKPSNSQTRRDKRRETELLTKVPKHMKKTNTEKQSQPAQQSVEFALIESIIKQSENDFKMSMFEMIKDGIKKGILCKKSKNLGNRIRQVEIKKMYV